VAGRIARLGSGGYNASKWAVNAFSESLRQEVTTRGVRISLVEPGAVETELTDHITHESTRQLVKETIAKSRAMKADDIARAIVYIVSQPDYVAINEVLIRPTDQER
jgi:NADP-dependent 3-hydroxy acid dehydrogenase YdfG